MDSRHGASCELSSSQNPIMLFDHSVQKKFEPPAPPHTVIFLTVNMVKALARRGNYHIYLLLARSNLGLEMYVFGTEAICIVKLQYLKEGIGIVG